MNRYDRRSQSLAAGLSALAGYVDAFAFIKLGGFFVSFMSGNSTRLGVGLAERSSPALVAGGIIACFVLGVAMGTLVGHLAQARRRVAVLACVTLMLVLAASFGELGLTAAAIAAMAFAMGAENAVFERDGEVAIGLTYMTGALVKFGQKAMQAFLGGARFAWLPYLMLWSGLVLGVAMGATIYAHIGLSGLWFAAVAALLLSVAAALIGTEA